MAGMSNYLENQLINHIFRTNSFTKPTTLAIALVTVDATDSSTGATITEVANSNNYSRQVLNPDDGNWADTAGGNGTTSNLVAINFPTASGSWGEIVGVAICDSSVWGAGNVLLYGTLSVPKTVTNGDNFGFPIGNLIISLS